MYNNNLKPDINYATVEERLNEMESSINYLKAKVLFLEEENAETKTELLETKELLAISLKRNTLLEHAVFEHNDDEEIVRDEDEQPILKNVIATESPHEDTVRDFGITLHTTLELKANAIVEHLKEAVKPRNDAVFMNSREIITFLKNDIDEDLRLKDIKNPRQAKKDILEKAVKLFSDSVQIIKNKSGNKVTGIALKPSVNRRDTYTC
jgi:hypothetical protein